MKKQHLPKRWDYKHGAYYYRPSPGTRHLWDNKSWFRLGKTEEEAWRTWLFRNPPIRSGKPRTISEAMDTYCATILPALMAKTQREYLRAMGRLRPVFGHLQPRAIRPSHIYEYATLRRKTVIDNVTGEVSSAPAPVIAKREVATFSAILQECVHWGLIDENPARQVRLRGSTPRKNYVTDSEVVAFIQHCGNPLIAAYVSVKLMTGLRQGQMLGLRRDWWDGSSLIVPPAKGGRGTEYVDTDSELADALRAVSRPSGYRVVPSTEYFITSKHGTRYTSDGFRSIWQRAMDRYIEATGNSHFTENDLRAKVASDSENLTQAQERLGHTSNKTTMTYYIRKPRAVAILKRKDNER